MNNSKIIEKKKFSILNFITIVFIILLITSSVIYISIEISTLRKKLKSELITISQLKIEQISAWHQDNIQDTKLLSEGKLRKQVLIKWLQNRDREDSLALSYNLNVESQLHSLFNIMITDINGNILLSAKPAEKYQDSSFTIKVRECVQSKSVACSDIYKCNVDQSNHIDYFSPFLNEKNEVIGVLVCRQSPDSFFNRFLNYWPVTSKSNETFIARAEDDSVIFLSKLRFLPVKAMKEKISLKNEQFPVVQALIGKTGITDGKDYRGIRVIAYLSKIPNTSWVMVSKIDKKELYRDLYYEFVVLLLISILLFGFVILSANYIGKKKRLDIYKQLYETKKEFETTIYSIGDAVIVTDNKGKIKVMNQEAVRMTGYTETEANGKKLADVFNIINEESRQVVENPFEKVIRQGLVVGLANHTLLINKNSDEIPIADSGAPVKDENGNITGMVIVFRDQTEERKQEKLLKLRLKLFEYSYNLQLEEMFVKTLDEICDFMNSPIGFFHTLDEDEKMIQLQAWSSRTTEEYCTAIGKGLHYHLNEAGVWTDCIHQRKPVIHNDYNSLTHKKGLPDGHAPVIRELVVPVFYKNKIVAILGIGNKKEPYNDKDAELLSFLADELWELIYTKKIETQIIESEQKYRNIIKYSPFGVHMYTVNDNNELILTGSNLASDDILNIKTSELHGKTIEEAFPGLKGSEIPEKYLNVALNGESWHSQQVDYDDHEHIKGAFEVFAFQDTPGHVTVMFQDITQRIMRERELQNYRENLEKMVEERTHQLQSVIQELESFSYSISHDLRAPLRAISGFTKVLSEEYALKLDEEGKRICNLINSSTTHMSMLIEDLLRLSHVGRTELQKDRIDMFQLVNEVVKELLADNRKGHIRFEINPLCPTYGDAVLLRQVWVNLISNAIKFSSKKENPEIKIGCIQRGNTCEYYISDNGAGFDMKYANKLFGIFQRLHSLRDYEGTGVGLAIVRQIIQKHGGNIWAESEPDRGAKFYFTLPVSE